MANNGVKGHKKSASKESRAVGWGGGRAILPRRLIGSLRWPIFFALFSTTAELSPRLECLTKPLKTSTREATSHRKNSPNIKSQNGTRGKEGDNHVYFGVSHHFYFEPSCSYNQHDF